MHRLRCVYTNQPNVRKPTVVVNPDRVTIDNLHDFIGSVTTEIFNLWLLPTAHLVLRKCKNQPHERNYVTSPSKADPHTDRGVLVIKTAFLSGFRAKCEKK